MLIGFTVWLFYRDVKGTDYVKVNLNKDRQMSAALRTCKGLWTVDTHEALAQGARAKKQSREMGECGSLELGLTEQVSGFQKQCS